MSALRVIHDDAELVAVNKPAGLLVHRSAIDARETRFAVQLLRDQLGKLVYPVHRLDRPTSGVLLFALCKEAARRLADSFAAGGMSKTYVAVVRGWLPDHGDIDYPLTEEPAFRSAPGPRPVPQPARTSFDRLATAEMPWPCPGHPSSRYCLVAVRPHTGRMHQIRRHLKHVFHPVIGDVRHGDGLHNRHFRTQLGSTRLLLHASELSFQHPSTGQRLTLRAPVGDDFLRVVDALGWSEWLPGGLVAQRLPPSNIGGGP